MCFGQIPTIKWKYSRNFILNKDNRRFAKKNDWRLGLMICLLIYTCAYYVIDTCVFSFIIFPLLVGVHGIFNFIDRVKCEHRLSSFYDSLLFYSFHFFYFIFVLSTTIVEVFLLSFLIIFIFIAFNNTTRVNVLCCHEVEILYWIYC